MKAGEAAKTASAAPAPSSAARNRGDAQPSAGIDNSGWQLLASKGGGLGNGRAATGGHDDGGRPLAPDQRAYFGAAFGHDFSRVRVHAKPTPGVEAPGATRGNQIHLPELDVAPPARSRRILAHELAHIVQQQGGNVDAPPSRDHGMLEREAHAAAARVLGGDAPGRLSPVAGSPLQAYCDPTVESCPPPTQDEQTPAGGGQCVSDADAPNFTPIDPNVPSGINVDFTISGPTGPEGEHDDEVVQLPLEFTDEQRFQLYALPVEWVFRSQEQADYGTCTTADWFTSSPDQTGPPAPPPFAPGDTVYALDGPLEVVAATARYVVTRTYTKFAVGAGSMTLVRTPNGYTLVDAGMHQVGGSINEVLADAAIDRLEQALGGESIEEVLITHIHTDHTALLPRVYARWEIGTLRLNALQALTPGAGGGTQLDALVEAMIEARRARVEGQVREDFRNRAGPWNSIADASEREAAREAAIQAELRTRLTAMRATQVQLDIPSGGRVVAANMPLGTIAMPAGMRPDGGPITQPAVEPGLVTILDPGAGADTRQLEQTGRLPSRSGVVDTNSSTYIIDMPSGTRLMVISDQRVPDMLRLRSQFEAQLQRLGHAATFQVWDMTHHIQVGWTTGTAIARGSQLADLTRMLAGLRREPNASGPGGDLLTVSVHGDPGSPHQQSYVDPATVWLLRSMGMEVIPATGGGSTTTAAQDVAILQVAFGEGRSVTAPVGQPYPGLRPSDPLVAHANAALASLEADIGQLEDDLAGDQTAEERSTTQSSLTDRRAEHRGIRAALETYIRAVRDEIYRSTRGETRSRPAVAPADGGTEPALAQAQALRTLLTSHAAPQIGELRPFDDTAMVVIGREQMASLSPEGRALLDARTEVRNAAHGLRASSPPAHRDRVIGALDRYRTQLQAAHDRAPRGSRELLTTEISRVDSDLFMLTGMNTEQLQALREAARLADRAAHNAVRPTEVENISELTNGETAARLQRESNGYAVVQGRLFRVSSEGETVRVSAVEPQPLSAQRSLPSGGGGTGGPTGTPAGGGGSGGGSSLSLRTTARGPGSGADTIHIGEALPPQFRRTPNIINFSGHRIVLGDGQTIEPTRWQPIRDARPGEYVIRGFGPSSWFIVHPETGRPLAGVMRGGEWWRLETNGTWTMVVDAQGRVLREGGAAPFTRDLMGAPYGRPMSSSERAGEGAPGRPSGGARAVAGGLGLIMIANEILGPVGRVLNQQRRNIASRRGAVSFWIQAGAAPQWEMRTQNTESLKPSTTEPSTGVFSEPVYHFVKDISLAGLRRGLSEIIHSYQDLLLWLDLGKTLGVITVEPPMPRRPSVAERQVRREIRAWVDGEAGNRRGEYYDITQIITEVETRTLRQLDEQMRARVRGWGADERGNVFRLRSGSATRLWRSAHGQLVLSSAQLLGPDPWVRTTGRRIGGGAWSWFRRGHSSARVMVEPANADAQRSALVSAYAVHRSIEDVVKEVENGGREVLDRSEEHGRLQSFVAGPAEGDPRFGVTRYYRNPEMPNTSTAAIGQLNRFWVDADELEPIVRADVDVYAIGDQHGAGGGGDGE